MRGSGAGTGRRKGLTSSGEMKAPAAKVKWRSCIYGRDFSCHNSRIRTLPPGDQVIVNVKIQQPRGRGGGGDSLAKCRVGGGGGGK